mmetsp:Transcript_126198/g.218626  ORF Transcript_126198/g.218626 Transcript_126198/m.218626 type:complete len:201 (-) Transcript_126198:1027-1629(-)
MLQQFLTRHDQNVGSRAIVKKCNLHTRHFRYVDGDVQSVRKAMIGEHHFAAQSNTSLQQWISCMDTVFKIRWGEQRWPICVHSIHTLTLPRANSPGFRAWGRTGSRGIDRGHGKMDLGECCVTLWKRAALFGRVPLPCLVHGANRGSGGDTELVFFMLLAAHSLLVLQQLQLFVILLGLAKGRAELLRQRVLGPQKLIRR